MNMQAIQILFLVVDGIIKLAPWRIVTETVDRIGYGASEVLARCPGVIAVVCAGLCPFPVISMSGFSSLTGHVSGGPSLHIYGGDTLFHTIVFALYLGMMVWGGVWWRSRRASMLPRH